MLHSRLPGNLVSLSTIPNSGSCEKVVKLFQSAKSSSFLSLNPRDKKHFWKAVKYPNKQPLAIPTLHHQDTTSESNSEKASLLNEFFLMF